MVISTISAIYIPIDFSNLSEVIPNGDDVICSTFCSIVNSGRQWKSHVLLTNTGIGFKKRKGENVFYKWTEFRNAKIYSVNKRVIKLYYLSKKTLTKFFAIRPKLKKIFVTKSEFGKRAGAFSKIALDLWNSKNNSE